MSKRSRSYEKDAADIRGMEELGLAKSGRWVVLPKKVKEQLGIHDANRCYEQIKTNTIMIILHKGKHPNSTRLALNKNAAEYLEAHHNAGGKFILGMLHAKRKASAGIYKDWEELKGQLIPANLKAENGSAFYLIAELIAAPADSIFIELAKKMGKL